MLTLLTPATEFGLIDVSAARQALRLTDESDDELLKVLIDRASDIISRHCKRAFALETVTETFRLERCVADLVLGRYPVAAIASVTENEVALDPTSYEETCGVLTRLSGAYSRSWIAAKVEVTYTAGYALPGGCPPALAHACIQLVVAFWSAAGRDPHLRAVTVEGISSRSYFGSDAALPPDVAGLLVAFRNLRTR